MRLARTARLDLLILLGLLAGFFTTLTMRRSSVPYCVPSSSTQSTRQPSSPVGQGGLLLVGVMTAEQYIDTRAWTVWRTWAKSIPGTVVFFSSERTRSRHPELPVVALPGVDDSYPPQRKSFMMLKWMAEHGLGHYDWFLRADDDLFVRGDKLEIFLRSLNSSKPLFIGQAGLGKPHEYGQLSLADDENYCMGGPGMILSKETLAQLGPHITHCLLNMFTDHEDVEIGRCVRKHVGVTCTWSYEMQAIFYNNQSGSNAYKGDLNVADVHNAITMHPVKNISSMVRLNSYVKQMKAADMRFRWVQISRDVCQAARRLSEMGVIISDKKYADCDFSPTLLKFSPRSTRDIISWDFLSPSVRYCSQSVNCPRHNVESYLKYALADIVRQIMDSVNRQSRQKGRILVFKEVLYGYHRVDPVHGAQYVLDLLLMYRRFKGRRVSVPVRRHTYVQQAFSDLVAIDESGWRLAISPNSPLHSGPVHVVLPLAGRLGPFRRFTTHVGDNFLKGVSSPLISLHIVLFASGDVGEDEQILSELRQLQSHYGPRVISWTHISDAPFNRGLALNSGASLLPSHSLLFLTDVDVLFSVDAIRRVQLNTIQGRQVYFPMVFSEYAPKPNEPRITHFGNWDRNGGYLRHFGFGIAAIYKSDLDKVGGFDQKIKGWGKEDVQFFEQCLHSHHLTIMRVADPDLVHVYHEMHCDPSLPPAQHTMCLGSMASSYASGDTLADTLLERRTSRSPAR